jgi:hypothetical protein
MLDIDQHGQHSIPAESAPAVQADLHPTINQLEHGRCKWPVSIDPDGLHRFCAEPIEWHGDRANYESYCREHRAIAFTKGGTYAPRPRSLPLR